MASNAAQNPIRHRSQSAAIPFRVHKGSVEILLITSRRSRNWIIPKGDLEGDMSPADSAAKEAWEEAGVKGRILGKKLGVYRYEKYDSTYEVTVFPMEVRKVFSTWPEKSERTRQWVGSKKAAKIVFPDNLADIISKLNVKNLKRKSAESNKGK